MYLPLSLFLPLRPHLKHRLSEIVLLCLFLTAGEWLQEKVPILAFPWSAAWLAVTSSPLLLQSATLISCRLTSFIIFLLNGLHGEIYTSKKRFAYTAFALLLQGANLSYGLYSVNLDKKLDNIYPQIDVICAQDSLEGREKSHRKALDSARSYLSIMESCWRWGTDLVLLPETAVSKDYDEQLKEFSLISDFADTHGCTLVTGSFYLENGKDLPTRYNMIISDMGAARSLVFLIDDYTEEQKAINELHYCFVKYPEQMQGKLEDVEKALDHITENLDKGYREVNEIVDSVDKMGN